MNPLQSSAWLKNLGERAPELAAILVLVGMFLYHLSSVATQTNLILLRIDGSIKEVNEALGASTVALTILSEQARAEMGNRAKEHSEMLKRLDKIEDDQSR